MIFLNGHGRTAVPDGDVGSASYSGVKTSPVSQVCGFCDYSDYGDPEFGPFGYLAPDAQEWTHQDGLTQKLDDLADAMIEDVAAPDQDSYIPPVFTYLGQFIDHDITANTDRDTGLSTIEHDEVVPVPRKEVVGGLGNLRAGSLNLDSLYGGGPVQGPFAQKLRRWLRFPDDPAKLWAGTLSDVGFGSVPLPDDIAGDLLRVGRVLKSGLVSEDELKALPDHLREMFVNADGTIKEQRAIIGDARNDENLAVAQVHLAFVRLHNKIVDEAHKHVKDPTDRDAVYAWAQKMVRWHYQWLVVNIYLPAVCDDRIVDAVKAAGAPLYKAFFDRVGRSAKDLMPMPLEFSVAAFRFGHSMARASYDWNRFFGRPVGSTAPFADQASFVQLFQFTGDATEPMPVPGQDNAGSLPSHWPVEWDRFALPVSAATPDRSARRIDTNLAPPLLDMINQPEGLFRNLAKRNLRRGLRLNIPSAQDCIDAVEAATKMRVPRLSAEQLSEGSAGPAIEAGGFTEKTPLWFYVLREAEVLGTRGRLGPLGSVLIAETLCGLVVQDPSSYWWQSGSDDQKRWHPADGVKPGGHVIDSLPDMLRAAGLL
ncbi:heme peroxidase [Litoreibacter ponti]|uniref:Heme peroxidase n=2 Tax=Litoreibacter ponti TaxID=1510457 RepID=A0A2T6BCQ0_9RHOB|nr:heme peroxidase [Litoreibacter ponti]